MSVGARYIHVTYVYIYIYMSYRAYEGGIKKLSRKGISIKSGLKPGKRMEKEVGPQIRSLHRYATFQPHNWKHRRICTCACIVHG